MFALKPRVKRHRLFNKKGSLLLAHSPTFPSLHLRHSSFSNPSVGSPTSQLIIQSFFRFSYVTGSSLTSPGEPSMMFIGLFLFYWVLHLSKHSTLVFNTLYVYLFQGLLFCGAQLESSRWKSERRSLDWKRQVGRTGRLEPLHSTRYRGVAARLQRSKTRLISGTSIPSLVIFQFILPGLIVNYVVLVIPFYNNYSKQSTPVVHWLSYSPLYPRLAGSIPAGVDGFFSERKNPEYDFLRKGSKAGGPVS